MALSIALSAALGVLLIVTIYLTRFDLQWLAFLGGVLFAAVLALVSQASKAEWRLMRRSKQLERMREQLSQAVARSRNAAQGLQAAEKRMRLVNDRLPIPVLYFDRDERCHYHNKACTEWLELAPDRIDGELLRDIAGGAAYSTIAPHVAQSLSGQVVDYQFARPGKSGEPVTFTVRQIPYAPDDGEIIGFYMTLTRTAPEPVAAGKFAKPAGTTPLSAESGETLYLRSITEELMNEGDPCARLERALEQNEFLLFAQKILPLKSGIPEPDCYEILLRFREEEESLLPPGGFIPVAERYGMLEEIDRWVVHNLISWCLNRRRNSPDWRIPLFCVNLSEASVTSPEFTRFVCDELKRPDFPARGLCFEISEADVLKHNDGIRRFIAELAPVGCRFSVDGFGGAKVSFSYLEELAFNFLKIDGSIIQNILHDPTELAKTHAINTVSQKSGMRTIAEFVETRETLDKLRKIGVDYVQGFGIARPGPIEELP